MTRGIVQLGIATLLLFASLMLGACGTSDTKSAAPTDGDADTLVDGDGNVEGEKDAEEVGIAPHKEQRGNYTILWLRGTPYEMGKQHGELLHDAIKDAIEFVKKDPIMSRFPGIAQKKGLLDLANTYSFKDMLDECQGLVDATTDVGMTMDWCLTLNFGDVIIEFIQDGMPEAGVKKVYKPRAKETGPGCSNAVAAGPASPDGRLYHARNLDWGSMDISVIHRHPVIFVRQPKDALAHIFVGFPMNLSPYTGMNEAGVSICSDEADPKDSTEQALSGRSHVQMLGQLLKSAKSLDEARSYLKAQKSMACAMLIVADGNAKDASVFEMTAAHYSERRMDKGLIYATNHFIGAETKDADVEPVADSSAIRFERLTELVTPEGKDTLYGKLDPAHLVQVMRDRINPRTGVSAPWDEKNIDNDAGLATNGPMHMVVFDPAKRLFWVAAGVVPIPAQPFVGFSLDELLGRANPVLPEPAQFDGVTIPDGDQETTDAAE